MITRQDILELVEILESRGVPAEALNAGLEEWASKGSYDCDEELVTA